MCARRSTTAPQRGERAGPFSVVADHHQLHLRDGDSAGDLGDAWTVKAVEDRVAVAEGVVGIGTGAAGRVDVEIEVFAAAPPLVLSRVEHATEASLALPSGVLLIAGCTEAPSTAARVRLAPGTWRVRTLQRALGTAKERAHVLLWAAAPSEPVVLTRAQAAPKVAKRSRTSPLQDATALARSGRIEEAEVTLTALAPSDLCAHAALAEIAALRGDWARFVGHAEAFFADPGVAGAGNVFTDLTRLFRRAAAALGTPEIVDRAAAVVPARFAGLRDATLLRDVIVPGERVDPITDAEREAYQRAVDDARTGKRFRDRPVELARHEVALAGVMRHEEALLRLWDEHHAALSFDDAVRVGRWVALRGDHARAWEMIHGKLATWFPVSVAQVVPLVLILDRTLAPMMTPERAEVLLRTVRAV